MEHLAVDLVVAPVREGLQHRRVADVPAREPVALRVAADRDVVSTLMLTKILLVQRDMELLVGLGQCVEAWDLRRYSEVALDSGEVAEKVVSFGSTPGSRLR